MARGFSKQHKRLEWRSAVPELIPGPAYCPDAVDEYVEMFRLKKKGSETVLLGVRKHLLYLGWKVDFVVDGETMRFRYSSPRGESFYSLPQVCAKFGHVRQGMEPGSPPIVRGPKIGGRKISSASSSDKALPSPISRKIRVSSSGKAVSSPISIKINVSPSGKALPSPSSAKSRVSGGKLSKLCAPSDEIVFEPEYCPEAVKDYCSLSPQGGAFNTECKPRAMKAKKHLSAIGWSFYYIHKGGKWERRELRYCSPNGKVFASLLTACKWCVEAGALTFSDLVGNIGNANVTKDSDEHLIVNRSHSQLLDVECPGDDSRSVIDEFLNLPNESSEGHVPSVEGEVCTTSIARKKRNNDELHCTEGRRFPKRGKKLKSLINMNANFSTPVRRSSKRVQNLAASSCHQSPRTVLSWLIDNDVILPRAKVHYRGKNGLPMAEGRIARKGIKCDCCGVIFTLTKFEAHAGSTNHRPSANIFLEDGRSLMECQLQLKQRKGDRCSMSQLRETKGRPKTNDIKANDCITNDDICSVCHDGGDLVLCDQCPSSFHTQCLGLKEVPDGDWFCPSCCCHICGMGRYDGNEEQDRDCSVLTCCQCDHRYHAECLRNKGITKCYPEGFWFCQDSCEEIFRDLRKILGKPVPVGTDNLTWSLLQYTKANSYDQHTFDDECLLENYGKLNVALSVMHECFDPIKEPRTGRDLVEDVIFSRWSELNRMNFRGFYTVVLEKNDELISAATVRVYGKRVAEVPLVATRLQYRRLGMCRILMNELEKKLVELGVERLVLPAVPSVVSTWTTSFGFSEMSEADRLKFLDYSFLNFQGTVICQKVLTSNASSVSNLSTGTQADNCYHVNPNVEFYGNSTASGVFQGEQQVEETCIVDQESMCIAKVVDNSNNFKLQTTQFAFITDTPMVDYVVQVDRSTPLESLTSQTKIPVERPVRDTTDDKQAENNNRKSSILKFYTRRGTSTRRG